MPVGARCTKMTKMAAGCGFASAALLNVVNPAGAVAHTGPFVTAAEDVANNLYYYALSQAITPAPNGVDSMQAWGFAHKEKRAAYPQQCVEGQPDVNFTTNQGWVRVAMTRHRTKGPTT